MKYIIRIPVQVLTMDENGHVNTNMSSSLDIKVEAPTQAEAVDKTEVALNVVARQRLPSNASRLL